MEKVDGKSFENVQVVCLYFATSWCPACKKFTPVLIDLYKKINSLSKKLEIIFVTQDNDESKLKEYF